MKQSWNQHLKVDVPDLIEPVIVPPPTRVPGAVNKVIDLHRTAGPGGLSKEQVVTSSKTDEMRDYHRFKEEKA